MKDVDLAPLREIDARFSVAVGEIESSYKCNWDDPVHDSYSAYVKQVRGLAESLKKSRNRAELLEKEADALNVEGLLKTADALCREADSV